MDRARTIMTTKVQRFPTREEDSVYFLQNSKSDGSYRYISLNVSWDKSAHLSISKMGKYMNYEFWISREGIRNAEAVISALQQWVDLAKQYLDKKDTKPND